MGTCDSKVRVREAEQGAQSRREPLGQERSE